MTHPVNQLNQWSLWAETNPASCPCRGGGWLLSDFDTFHRCGLHGAGVPHPEDEWADFDHSAHYSGLLRKAIRTFHEASGLSHRAFFCACLEVLEAEDPSPQDWVNAAERVAEERCREVEEEAARAAGYSCVLERRLEDESRQEAFENGYRF